MNYKYYNSTQAQHIGGSLPAPVKEILRTGDAWVAGGYILSKITGTPVKDIDIFFKDYSAYNYARSILTAKYDNIANIKEYERNYYF